MPLGSMIWISLLESLDHLPKWWDDLAFPPANCDSHVNVDEDGGEGDGSRGRQQRQGDDGRHDDGDRVDTASICERGRREWLCIMLCSMPMKSKWLLLVSYIDELHRFDPRSGAQVHAT